MANRITLVAILVFVLIAAGCTAIGPSVGAGATVAPTGARTSPAGTEPAIVWTIDQNRLPVSYSKYSVSPGRHSVSVLPLQGSLSATLAYGKSAEARGIRIAAITVDVEPGQELKLAAVVRRHRTFVDDDSGNEAWQTTVLPYIVSANN